MTELTSTKRKLIGVDNLKFYAVPQLLTLREYSQRNNKNYLYSV